MTLPPPPVPESMITVQVRYFAGMREALGCDVEALALPAHTSSEAILTRIAERHPAAAAWCRASRVAVGDRFARGPVQLREGDELSIIPPVSGG